MNSPLRLTPSEFEYGKTWNIEDRQRIISGRRLFSVEGVAKQSPTDARKVERFENLKLSIVTRSSGICIELVNKVTKDLKT